MKFIFEIYNFSSITEQSYLFSHSLYSYNLLDIPSGKIIGLALKRRFRVERVDPSGLFDMLEEWAYGTVDNTSLKFRDYKFHGAWSLIKKQGKH